MNKLIILFCLVLLGVTAQLSAQENKQNDLHGNTERKTIETLKSGPINLYFNGPIFFNGTMLENGFLSISKLPIDTIKTVKYLKHFNVADLKHFNFTDSLFKVRASRSDGILILSTSSESMDSIKLPWKNL